ncbi:uncharacterized protein EMH_0073550 [Eimeria mitis]|uniref:Transmembrane protein n=1 Tax=Eimeria mitis TaxID=44415 RepID=U6KE15_9EIME|nr:uncharacterized protein EMH_0073550 [Eimeria mitis]CDJ36270.1 hypothetical protein EMH_0073550 [Eimeria mitis]
MKPIVMTGDSPPDGEMQLEALRPGSIQPATYLHAWEDAVHGATGDSSELYWRRKHVKEGRKWSTSRLRRGIFWALLSTLIPALIISVLRVVCRASPSASTDRTAGTSTRRLSHSDEGSQGDSTLSRLVEECAALEADLGLNVSEESNQPEGLGAAEQVARIAHTLFLEGLAFEMQHAQQPLPTNVLPLPPSLASSVIHDQYQPAQWTVGIPDQQYGGQGPLHMRSDLRDSQPQPGGLPPETVSSSPQPLGEAFQPFSSGTQSFSVVPSPDFWTPLAASASSQPLVAAFQSVEARHPAVAAPQPVGLFSQTAPLLRQVGAQRSSNERRRTRVSRKPYMALDPDSWVDVIPAVDVSLEGRRESQTSPLQGISLDQAAPCSSAAYEASAGEAEGARAGQSSLEPSAAGAGKALATAPGAHGASEISSATGAPAATAVFNPEWIRTHPYVNLPVLQEGVVPPLIPLSPSNFRVTKGTSVRKALAVFRRMFLSQTLSQADAVVLAEDVYRLAIASAVRARAAKRMRRALHGAANIGQQFLALDAIVSAMHVLGQSPSSCTWWEAFVQCFDTSYRYPEPARRAKRDSTTLNINLANRMLAAMSIYKTGNRPELEEIIHLKRILFFSPYAPLIFKDIWWGTWRSDHLRFEKEHPSFSEWLRKRRHPPK